MGRPRPHIPLSVRCKVAAMGLLARGVNVFAEYSREDGETLAALLERQLRKLAEVLGTASLHLDHDPALRTREFNPRTGKYTPDANDPAYLVYRTVEDHRTKTFIRGERGQFSDRTLIKRERRRERKTDKSRDKYSKKYSRPIKSASRWPPKGSRPLRSRPLHRQ